MEFEDDRIVFDQWKDMKPQMPYGQLPVMRVDDGPMQTQSTAMLRWVGSQSSKMELYPVAASLYKVEEAMGVMEDFKQSWSPCLYISNAPTKYGYPEGYAQTDVGKETIKAMREAWVAESMPRFAGYLQGLLAANGGGGGWLASSKDPTIVDCVAVPFLRGFTRGHIDHVPTTCLDAYPALVDYIKRFCALVPGRYTDGLHE
eukprot:scaffold2230_cov187-Amphora_coffeaeformis.AAC.9